MYVIGIVNIARIVRFVAVNCKISEAGALSRLGEDLKKERFNES